MSLINQYKSKDITAPKHERLTQAQKNSYGKQYYKTRVKYYANGGVVSSNNSFSSFGEDDLKANYDLYNGKINIKDFKHVTNPHGEDTGELPADFVHRDIISPSIKRVITKLSNIPFKFRCTAVNPEATTQREEEKFNRIKQYVVDAIMRPVQDSLKDVPEEQRQEAIEDATPDKIHYYMAREYQTPAEVLGQQIINYESKRLEMQFKTDLCAKHLTIGAREIMWVGIRNGLLDAQVINPRFFKYDKSADTPFIEDSDWAVAEYRLTASQIIQTYGEHLSNAQIDKIYSYQFVGGGNPSLAMNNIISDSDFWGAFDDTEQNSHIRVVHATWKGLRKIGFLTYKDFETGQEHKDIVSEEYKLNKSLGDISINWVWIPEVHQCTQILDDIIVEAEPVAYQYKNVDNLYYCKLPFIGVVYDDTNSAAISPIDRMKEYNYLYDIILYRLELLIASDKGKLLLMNINGVPNSQGIDTKKWHYFLESNKIGWVNPQEEGNRGGADITNMAKEIDMSLASDIQKYINLAEYVKQQCKEVIGITPAFEGNIQEREAVQNVEQVVNATEGTLAPLFKLHNIFRKNVIKAIVETAKIAYKLNPPKYITHVLDDLSIAHIKYEEDLFTQSDYGIFLESSQNTEKVLKSITNLAQAALQNQQADLRDVVKIMNSDNISSIDEKLALSERKRQQAENKRARMEKQMQSELLQEAEANAVKEHERKKELIVLEAEEKRKTELAKAAIMPIGFDENKDRNNNGVIDSIEAAKFFLEKDKVDIEKFKTVKEAKQKDRELSIKEKEAKNKKIAKK